MPPDIICRLCRSVDVRMITIAGSSMQSVFEKLTNKNLHTADRRPTAVCYICHAHLKKCYELMKMSDKAEHLFTVMGEHDQITKESLIDDQLKDMHGILTYSKLESIDTTIPPATLKVKIEPEVDDHVMTPASADVRTDIEQSDVIETYNVIVKIDEIKTEDELEIDEMRNEWNGSPQALETKDSDVDIENVSDIGDSIPLEKFGFEQEPDVLQKKGVAAVAKSKLKKKDRPHERLHECDECQRSFKTVSHLRTHARSHTGVAAVAQSKLKKKRRHHECDVCQHRFASLWHLRTHIRSHTGEKPFQCDICQRCFSEQSSLNSHLFIHTGERRFECNICQRRFTKKNHLNRHLLAHSGIIPFQCNVCGSKFFDKSVLECHIRTHTGEKPFQCDTCDRRFNYKHVLIEHFRTHTGEKPHRCDICDRRFAQKFTLQTHLKKMNGKDTFKKKSLKLT